MPKNTDVPLGVNSDIYEKNIFITSQAW